MNHVLCQEQEHFHSSFQKYTSTAKTFISIHSKLQLNIPLRRYVPIHAITSKNSGKTLTAYLEEHIRHICTVPDVMLTTALGKVLIVFLLCKQEA